MNTQKKRQISHLVTTLVAGLACSANAHAVDIYWTGGTDANLSTAANWQGGLVPITSTDARLIFDAATVGAGSFAVTNDLVPDAPVYGALQFNNGGFTVAGSQIALRPYSTSNNYYTTVISNLAGNNIITAPLRIEPNSVNRILSTETLDRADIYVANGSLSLNGAVSAGQVNLTTYLGTTASLSMNGVSAKSFKANGGTQNLLGVLDSKTVTLQTNFIVGGSGGAINATDGTVSLASGSQLTLDNLAAASNTRLSGNLAMAAGTTFLLKGNAATDVAQNAGVLTVTGSNSALTHIKVEGAGANASMSFNSLSSSGLVNFASSGALGGAERIKFGTAPTLTNGLMSRALVNGKEFATYNAANGVIAATTATTLSGSTAADHVYIGATENLAGNSAINSLAVNNAAITGGSAINLASGKLLANGGVNIAPAINFGSSAGEIINMGTTVLAGGVNGSNGLSVLGNGSLELASAGSLTGAFTHNGQLVLSAGNALNGASVTSYSGLDIGATTQHFDSFTGGTSNNTYGPSALVGSGVSGTGRIVAVNNISLNQNLVNFSLEGANVSVVQDRIVNHYVTQTINGNIHASQNVNLAQGHNGSLGVVMNGVISGSAKVNNGSGTTFTNQNTYTGLTTGSLTLSGNGAISASSGFTGSYLAMRAADGDNGVLDRIGDTAAVTLGYGTLSLQGTGNVALSEDIGALNITGSSHLRMSNDTGSASLRADALNMASGSALTLSLGNASNFYVDVAPIVYSGTNVVKNVYAEKSIDGKLLPSWAAYDAGNGRISEALVNENALNSAGADEFVRVTDAVNHALSADRTVGGVNVDTTQAISGNGTLTVGSGQLLLWKDNTINIATLNFGANQGVVTNAGTNTIASVIAGSNGLVKNGEGTLVLTGNNTYTGTTQVEGGVLSVASGGRIGDVRVSGRLDLAGTAKVIENYGTVNLNAAYTNTLGTRIDGYGLINANAQLTNRGTIDGVVSNTNSVVNSGYIGAVENNGSLTNAAGANIGYLTHNSPTSFNNGGIVGHLVNQGVVVNNGTVSGLDNGGTFTNNGTLILDGASLGGTVVNRATAILNAGSWGGSTGYGVGEYKQTAGITTINGDLYSNVQLEGGILKGTGRIFGNLTVLNGAQVKPGNSPGLLEVTGDVSLALGSVLDMEVTYFNGVLAHDQLSVTGSLINNGQIKFSLGAGVSFINGGFASTNGQTIVLADIFSTNLLPGLGDGNLLVADTTGFTQSLTITADGNLAAVPEPETYAMMLAGLGLVGWSVRRRKAKAMQ